MKRKYVMIYVVSLLVFVLVYVFFVKEWVDGRYMIGLGDGFV